MWPFNKREIRESVTTIRSLSAADVDKIAEDAEDGIDPKVTAQELHVHPDVVYRQRRKLRYQEQNQKLQGVDSVEQAQNELKAEKIKAEIAEIRAQTALHLAEAKAAMADINGEEGEDKGLDGMLGNLLNTILSRSGSPPSQSPAWPSGPAPGTTEAAQAASVSARTSLTDDQIREMIASFPAKQVKQAAKLPAAVLQQQIQARMPQYSDETIERAVQILKGEA